MEIVEKNNKKVLILNYKDKLTFNQLRDYKDSGVIGVVHASTGHDNFPTNACKSIGLKQSWLDGFSTQSVIQLGVLLLLQSARMQIVLSNNNFTHKFVYKTGSEINDKFVLIIGSLGRIGSGLKPILEAFGMIVLEHDSKTGYGYSEKLLLDNLGKADYVFLCVNGENNREFFKEEYFKACKKKPVLINLVRKSLVNNTLLIQALNCRWISSYYVDDDLSRRFDSSFNALGTGHVGANTVEARARQKFRVKKLVDEMFASV